MAGWEQSLGPQSPKVYDTEVELGLVEACEAPLEIAHLVEVAEVFGEDRPLAVGDLVAESQPPDASRLGRVQSGRALLVDGDPAPARKYVGRHATGGRVLQLNCAGVQVLVQVLAGFHAPIPELIPAEGEVAAEHDVLVYLHADAAPEVESEFRVSGAGVVEVGKGAYIRRPGR